MEKYRRFKITVAALLLALLVALSTAVVALNRGWFTVYAADRYVELDGNSVFYTSIRGAEITHTEEIPSDKDEAVNTRYTMFRITGDQTVSYRQNLAYAWKTGVKDDDGNLTGEVNDNAFSIKLSFTNLNFKRYIIKFQSQQYVLTKDGKSENYLIFEPVDNKENFRLIAAQSLDENAEGEIKKYEVLGTFAKDKRVKISLGSYKEGNYKLKVNDEDVQAWFYNMYESCATYVSSGDNAVTPLTFSAQFEENAAEKTAEMVLYDISGQSFEMHSQSGTYKVKDTAAPVICFTQTPSYLEYNKKISLKYKVIDVLASSPRSTAYFYVLTGEQYASNEFDYDKTDYETKTAEEGEEETEEVKSPFIQVSSTSDIRVTRDPKNTFIPRDMLDQNVYGLVKIYYELADVSGSSANKEKVFVDWYARESAPDALVDIYGDGLKNDTTKQSYFLKLIDTKDGATYARPTDLAASDVLAEYKNTVKYFQTEYQKKIDEAIAATEDKKLYAGGNKFYLPAIEYDFLDEYSNGRDYKYSLYYRAKTTGSATSLDANGLAIELSEADVTYRFTIFITDTLGNSMRYPVAKNENGEIEWKEIKTSDVWDEDFADLLPFFEFDVSYKEATAEDPENLSLAYVGTNYNGVTFKITGVNGTYKADYKLYVFDRNAIKRETGENIDYNTFIANIDKLFNNTYKDGINTRKYFTTVKAAADLLETDENYEKFKALNWNPTSISFTPQSVEDFYVVELTLKDNGSLNSTKNYATIASSVQTTPLKGESEWLKNNLTSIILLSVAGVCLIALIVLLIIKPKDKGDIDAVYTKVEEKSKGKKKNK